MHGMNKPIKKLWKKAGGYYDKTNKQYIIDDPGKFADFIILKCYDICDEYRELGSGETCAGEIIMYFGAEE
jgi:hypothetical protein